jgi:hypothetical protein
MFNFGVVIAYDNPDFFYHYLKNFANVSLLRCHNKIILVSVL